MLTGAQGASVWGLLESVAGRGLFGKGGLPSLQSPCTQDVLEWPVLFIVSRQPLVTLCLAFP